jgi:hypothetical protein
MRKGQHLQEENHQRAQRGASHCGLCQAKTLREYFLIWTCIFCRCLYFVDSYILPTPIFCCCLNFVNTYISLSFKSKKVLAFIHRFHKEMLQHLLISFDLIDLGTSLLKIVRTLNSNVRSLIFCAKENVPCAMPQWLSKEFAHHS